MDSEEASGSGAGAASDTAELFGNRTLDTQTSVEGESAGLLYKLILARTRASLLGKSEDPVKVGRYEVDGQLGSGGMGVVYSARDNDLDRLVAIKLLHQDVAASEGGQPRLIREAKALAKLSHPNVVHVYEVGMHEGRLFVAMERVDGVTLREWGEQKRRWDEIVRMHVEAGRGLVAAHAAGLVHRDYKLDNVIVGAAGRPRVLDFGLARPQHELEGFANVDELVQTSPSLEAVGSEVDITATGTVLGTPAYMAPEQLRGEDVDARADQFSFCVALFEALYGTRPFPGSTLSELVDGVLHRPPLEVAARSDVPSAIRAVLVRGLATEPSDRYPSVADLLAALEAAAQRHRPQPFAKWVGAGLVVAAVGGVAALAVTTPKTIPTAPVAAAVDAADGKANTVDAELAPPVVHEEADPSDPTHVTVHRLKNGLTVYIAPRASDAVVEGRVVLRTDALDERPGQEGFSSMVMAALETGTARLGAVDFDEEKPQLETEHALIEKREAAVSTEEKEALLREIAAVEEKANERNSPEFIRGLVRLDGGDMGSRGGLHTEYYSEVPPGRIGAWVDFHAEIIRNPIFRAPLGATRWNLRILDSYVWSDASMLAANRQFAANPSAFDPTSVATNLRRLPVSELREYHSSYFRPNNTALVFVGNVQAEQLLPAVEKAFGDWEAAPIPVAPKPDFAAMPERVAVEVTMPGPETLRVAWSVDALLAAGISRSELAALERALDGHDGLLASTIVRDGTVADAKSETTRTVFSILAKTASNSDPAAVEQSIVEALDAVASGKLEPRDWEAAEARRRLSASSWAGSSDKLASMIARSYLAERPWREVAAEFTDDGSARERIVRAAAGLLDAPRVVVHGKPGPPPHADIPPFPKSRSLRPESEEMSPFLQELIDRPFTKPEPQLLAAGRNFRITKIGAVDTTLVPRDGLRFDVRLVFATGASTEPWSCDAMRAKVDAAERDRTLIGSNLSVLCSAHGIELRVEGLDRDFEAIWAAAKQWLAGTELSDAAQDRYIEELLAARRDAAGDQHAVSQGLGLRGIQNGEDLAASLPSNAELEAAAAGRFATALGVVTGGPLRAAYIGPRPEAFESAGLPVSGASATNPSGSTNTKRTGQQILIVDSPGDSIDVRIAIRRLPLGTPREQVLGRLVAVGSPVAPLPKEQKSRLWFYGLEEGRAIRAPRQDLYTFGYSCEPADVLLAVKTGMATASTLPTLVTMKRTRHAVETEIRMARAREVELPGIVDDWRRLGLDKDPIIDQWLILPAVTEDELLAYTEALAELPPVITIVGDRRKLDVKALEALGEVVWVSAESVVRDPSMGEYAVLGYWDE